VLKAFPAGSSALDRVHDYRADAVLIDSATPGSGQVFDWALADGAPLDRRVVLAGGLNPDNVADAIHRVRPWGVDVSTGVERSPGRKDPRKVKDFIERARAAAPVPYEGDAHAPYDWQEDDF
jgi:phosphoribosylanthranilate isomerase